MHDHLFSIDGKNVAALVFDSDGAPFVVLTGESKISREIPWREGTQLRSAKRGEILRMLIAAENLPEIKIDGAMFTVRRAKSPKDPIRAEVDLHVLLFVTPRSKEPVHFRVDRCRTELTFGSGNTLMLDQQTILKWSGLSRSQSSVKNPFTVDGPDFVDLIAHMNAGDEDVVHRGIYSATTCRCMLTLETTSGGSFKLEALMTRTETPEPRETAFSIDRRTHLEG